MGNKLFTFLFAAMLPAMGAMATDHYVSVNGSGTLDGSSWDNALSFATFCDNVNSYENGDTFYFAGGTYYATLKTPTAITKGYTFVGGFNPALTGTEHATPAYPSSTPTIFSGDVNKNGLLDAADAKYCMYVITTTAKTSPTLKPFVIQGIDFTGCYDAEEKSKTHGGLFVENSYDVTLKNCRFYGNKCVSPDEYGGMALTAYRSTVFVQDCEFTNNTAYQRGGAVYVHSNASTKGLTVFERCLFSGNKVTAESSPLGSAVNYTHGPGLWLVNCTVTNNTAQSGGAIYVNGADDTYSRDTYVIGSTIAGNTGGNQINMSQGARLFIADSYVVGSEDDGSIDKAAIAITGDKESDKFSIVSKGRNIIGGYANQVADAVHVPSWDKTDRQGSDNLYSTVFGTNSLTNGVITPVVKTLGYEGTALKTAVTDAGWDVKTARVDVTVDQKSVMRGANVTAGAYAVTVGSVSVPFNDGFTYTTYSSTSALDFTSSTNLKAYVASAVSDGTVSFIQVDVVPANTGILVERTDGNTTAGTYDVAVTDETVDAPATNYLNAVTSTTTVTSGYVYGNGTEGIAFYRIGDSGYTIPAGKAYLSASASESASAKALRLEFGQATGIAEVSVNRQGCTTVYNLAGQAFSKAGAKGIYIINGKKYIKK